MREIKFRAWDKEEKEMLKDVSTWTDDFTDMLNETLAYYPKFGNLELMQYTGLKDKNGKDIYEGDIIKYETVDGFDASATFEEIREVKFIDGAFDPIYLSERDLHTYEDALLIIEKIEIIGNIYENPGLI